MIDKRFQVFRDEAILIEFLGGFSGLPIGFRTDFREALIGDLNSLIGSVGLLEKLGGPITGRGLGRLHPVAVRHHQIGFGSHFSAELLIADHLLGELAAFIEFAEVDEGLDFAESGFAETGCAMIVREGMGTFLAFAFAYIPFRLISDHMQ